MAYLAKKNLIDFERDSECRIMFPTFMGKRLIGDDGCPVVNNATTGQKDYTSYIFGLGAIGFGNGNQKFQLKPTVTAWLVRTS